MTEISWIGSLFGLGSLLGNIMFGVLLDRIGRKWCMYMLALPVIVRLMKMHCFFEIFLLKLFYNLYLITILYSALGF